MAKCPRFMIAENPMAEYGAEYVLHTQEPRFLAKRVYDNPTTDFEVVMEIDNIGQFFKGDVNKAAKLMSRLGDWWVSYINWEKQNNEKDEEQ